MIYLFNSAHRPLYRKNMLKTLFLPNGCVNEYRYSVTGDVRHVPSNFISKLQQLNRNEPVVIIFIDRFATGEYSYHPIRFGKYLAHREENQRLYISVELTKFMYPRDINRFNSDTKKPLLDAGSPKLTNNDPEYTNDGYYCIYEENIFSATSEYFSDDEAWSNIVKSLEDTKSYGSTANDSIVFMRAKLINTNNKPISPSLRDNKAAFNFIRGRKYQLDLTYKFPIQLIDNTKITQATISIDDPPFRLIDDSILPIDSISNSQRISLTTNKYPEETTGNISLSYPNGITGPTASIELNIIENRYFWPEVLLYAFLFSISSVIIGLDLTQIQPLTFETVLHNIWLKLIFAVIQAFVLFRITRLFGQRIV